MDSGRKRNCEAGSLRAVAGHVIIVEEDHAFPNANMYRISGLYEPLYKDIRYFRYESGDCCACEA